MNYIGSKLSLLPFISDTISNVVNENIKGLIFCDIFAGTGIVGKYFKNKGCKIISNDLQYYSYVLNKNYIGNNEELTFSNLKDINTISSTLNHKTRKEIICEYLDKLEIVQGFIYNNYCKDNKTDNDNYRLYFSNLNGGKCDAIRQKIENWKNQKKINNSEYYFLLASLIESIDKVANTASVYGAFLKKLKSSALKPLKMQPAIFDYSNETHKIYNKDANQLISEIKTDILYLDPPYNGRQYSANYHLLETIAKYDNPELFGKTGMRNCDKQKSKYCSKKEVLSAFEDLIMKANTKYIFLSYNNEGLMSLNDIKNIMSRKGEYLCFQKDYNRFKADNESQNRHIKSNKTIEYLHCVKVK